jgi:glucose-1-phosphate thymidylyltransferase
MESRAQEVVGLIPAAGYGTRLGRLPCSKEIFPLYAKERSDPTAGAITVMLESVLLKMRQAGVGKAYIVLREGKWDIPAFLGDGGMLDMHLAYLMVGVPYGVPYTLSQAYQFVREARIALGFGDIHFQADDAYSRILNWQSEKDAAVVLGLFPTERPDKVDMVELGDGHRVRRVIPKPVKTRLSHTWGIAVWTPLFTEFLHDYTEARKTSAACAPETFVGDVIQEAIDSGLRVEAVHVSAEPYVDIGTPEDLARMLGRPRS